VKGIDHVVPCVVVHQLLQPGVVVRWRGVSMCVQGVWCYLRRLLLGGMTGAATTTSPHPPIV
jgi:hypothetical protein